MKWDSHLHSALRIIDEYEGQIPLAVFMKDFFGRNSQMGSRDRKSIAALVYGFYRLGHAMKGKSREDRIFTGLLLCETAPSEILAYFRPELEKRILDSLDGKISFLETGDSGFRLREVFPWWESLSQGMNGEEFSRSLFRQPRVFIRARPLMQEEVKHALNGAGVAYETLGQDCFSLPPGTKTETLIPDPSWFEVQDYSSQRTGEYFKIGSLAHSSRTKPVIWDCCAASGGKSILLHDIHPEADLFVSDIRPAALKNLQIRFREAGIRHYRSVITDLRSDHPLPPGKWSFDTVILDAPCTGSGTWGRTPEQLYFFHPAQIEKSGSLQRKIAQNVFPYLKKGSPLIYITCSVFRGENEAVVQFLCEQFSLGLRKCGLISGYAYQADSMFAAYLS